jgi:luciferase family oxidoreductase group 1
MLPNHRPLHVAEQFGTLASLFPGRIDLGVGRAMGTRLEVAAALGRDNATSFSDQIGELLGYADASNRVRSIPSPNISPPIWILGSSINGAHVAANLGLPFAAAYHFSPDASVAALRYYRDTFQPSKHLDTPYGIIAVNAVVADTESQAMRLGASLEIAHLQLTAGILQPYVSPEEADLLSYSAFERASARESLARQFIGSPSSVSSRLMEIVEFSRADEVMVLTVVHEHAARVDSYGLLAQAWFR